MKKFKEFLKWPAFCLSICLTIIFLGGLLIFAKVSASFNHEYTLYSGETSATIVLSTDKDDDGETQTIITKEVMVSGVRDELASFASIAEIKEGKIYIIREVGGALVEDYFGEVTTKTIKTEEGTFNCASAKGLEAFLIIVSAISAACALASFVYANIGKLKNEKNAN